MAGAGVTPPKEKPGGFVVPSSPPPFDAGAVVPNEMVGALVLAVLESAAVEGTGAFPN